MYCPAALFTKYCPHYHCRLYCKENYPCDSSFTSLLQPCLSYLLLIYFPYLGKLWNEGGTPLLSLHGWMDNAGTWDTLAPLLPRNISLVAIDFPGHGFSSFMPLGTGSIFIHLVLAIERVVQHFGWQEVSLCML